LTPFSSTELVWPIGTQTTVMESISRLGDKAGMFGSVIAAASCPACFPALASLGAALGLGFLSEYEGLFITKLLPLFAAVALLANMLAWLRHRQWWRSLLGMTGPALVLAAMLLFFGQWWTAYLLYAGLALMVGFSLWDLFAPRARPCRDGACASAPQ
jgi:mercuric ion transport protein